MFAGRGSFASRDVPIPNNVGTLREAVLAKLQAIEGLTDLAGDRIYFYCLPQGATLPAATYYVAGSSGAANLGGPDGLTTSSVRVSCWSRSALEAAQMADSVRVSLQTWRDATSSLRILGVFNFEAFDLPEPPRNGSAAPLYQIVLSFDVIHRSS